MGGLITRAISSPANGILFNASISKLSFAEPDPPRPIVEKFNPEIGITIVGACWKFFIAYHDISHAQASKNLPIGKYPVGFVGLVFTVSTTNIVELFKLLVTGLRTRTGC